MAQRLEKKGFIFKARKLDNAKEIFLALTENGRKLFDAHENLHREMYLELSKTTDEKDLQTFGKVLDIIEKYLSEYKKKYHEK